jgi:peroxiredoxin
MKILTALFRSPRILLLRPALAHIALLSLLGLCPTSTGAAPSPVMLVAAATDGKTVNLSAVPGWRVVYFWGASCPCVTACERYSLVPLAEKYQGRVAFFAVASDGWDLTMPRPKLLAQIASHHLPYPVLLDTQHTIAQTLHAKVTPQTFVLDPQGRVVFHGMPDDSRRFLFTPGPTVSVWRTPTSRSPYPKRWRAIR